MITPGFPAEAKFSTRQSIAIAISLKRSHLTAR
jgi:hypothetical protein